MAEVQALGQKAGRLTFKSIRAAVAKAWISRGAAEAIEAPRMVDACAEVLCHDVNRTNQDASQVGITF